MNEKTTILIQYEELSQKDGKGPLIQDFNSRTFVFMINGSLYPSVLTIIYTQ